MFRFSCNSKPEKINFICVNIIVLEKIVFSQSTKRWNSTHSKKCPKSKSFWMNEKFQCNNAMERKAWKRKLKLWIGFWSKEHNLSWLLLELIHSKEKIIKSHILNMAAFCLDYFWRGTARAFWPSRCNRPNFDEVTAPFSQPDSSGFLLLGIHQGQGS